MASKSDLKDIIQKHSKKLNRDKKKLLLTLTKKKKTTKSAGPEDESLELVERLAECFDYISVNLYKDTIGQSPQL